MNNRPIKWQSAQMLMALIEKYYEFEPSGGSCHIALDDGNLDDDDIEFCAKESHKNGDYFGVEICKHLTSFTVEERELIVERPHDINENSFKK